MHRTTTLLTALLLLACAGGAAAQFADTGQLNDEIQRSDPALLAWASGVDEVVRGWIDYQDTALGRADYGLDTDMLGAGGTPVSLGDGGWATLTFDVTIADGPGDDLVVFENGFEWGGDFFGELAFVEVSSNGADFARLPALCRHVGAITGFDPTVASEYYNIAGAYAGGTGFDLADLAAAGEPLLGAGLLDLQRITHVRVVDVVGDVAGPGGSTDFLGRPVADPYPTPWNSSGMDLTGVGVLNTGLPVANETLSWGAVKSLY